MRNINNTGIWVLSEITNLYENLKINKFIIYNFFSIPKFGLSEASETFWNYYHIRKYCLLSFGKQYEGHIAITVCGSARNW